MQNQPAVTACACTGKPESILDEAGQPMLVEGVVVCPRCGRNPFGYTEPAACEQCGKPWAEHEFGVPAPFCQ